jgi:hypothetical protein
MSSELLNRRNAAPVIAQTAHPAPLRRSPWKRTLASLAAALILTGSTPQQPDRTKAFEDAARRAYPDAAIERCTLTFDAGQRQRVAELSGESFDHGVMFAYVARREGNVVGTVYFDRHCVRTKHELLLIAVDPRGALQRVEVLAFAEPEQYRPGASWYAQFESHALDRDLHVRRGIDAVSGATLTVHATVGAARRVLAAHRVAHAPAPPSPAAPATEEKPRR